LVEFVFVGSHLLVTRLTLQNVPISPPSNVGTQRQARRPVGTVSIAIPHPSAR
jgi:hypothetical protein